MLICRDVYGDFGSATGNVRVTPFGCTLFEQKEAKVAKGETRFRVLCFLCGLLFIESAGRAVRGPLQVHYATTRFRPFRRDDQIL